MTVSGIRNSHRNERETIHRQATNYMRFVVVLATQIQRASGNIWSTQCTLTVEPLETGSKKNRSNNGSIANTRGGLLHEIR